MPAEPIWFLDTLVEVNLDGAATGGAYALLTCTAPPGHMPPPHVHAREDEGFVVLEGELTLHTAAGSRPLGPGDAVHAPRGEVHTIEVTGGEPCRWIVLSLPAGFERFVRALGTPAPVRELPPVQAPDIERLVRIAGDHGITFAGPPGSRPAELVSPGGR